jgi:hypothetical protein
VEKANGNPGQHVNNIEEYGKEKTMINRTV